MREREKGDEVEWRRMRGKVREDKWEADKRET